MVKRKTPIGGYAPGPAPLWSLILLVIVLSCVCAWAILGFILWEFHPGRWDEIDRAITVFIAYALSAIGAAVVAQRRGHF